MIKYGTIQENFTWISLFYCIKHDTIIFVWFHNFRNI